MKMTEDRAQVWLGIASRLEQLHRQAYGPFGELARCEQPAKPTCSEAAEAIRQKCSSGWHLITSGWLVACAEDALRSLSRMIDEGAGGNEGVSANGTTTALLGEVQRLVADARR